MRKDRSVLLLKQTKEKTRVLAKKKGLKLVRKANITVTTPEGKKAYFFDWHDCYRFVSKYGADQ